MPVFPGFLEIIRVVNRTRKCIRGTDANKYNSESIPLEFGWDWHLQKWNGYGWLNAEIKTDYGWTDDAIIPFYGHKCFYFEFPIGKTHKLYKGKYRISKSFGHNNQDLNLTAEFRIQ